MTDVVSSVPQPSGRPPDDVIVEGERARQPQRTCVGCRERADRSSLLRVVVAGESAPGKPRPLEPDAAARRPGRGAWVHHDPACLERALKRRAFGRALRVDGPLEPSALREHVGATGTGPPSTSNGSGSTPDGHPMSHPR